MSSVRAGPTSGSAPLTGTAPIPIRTFIAMVPTLRSNVRNGEVGTAETTIPTSGRRILGSHPIRQGESEHDSITRPSRCPG
ncbi:conserved hypothetical protein [Ricinus communis]|uniref:Uncharacterized protein n=1 Tax=Ricinus communis TaxID=3988 RepID=B9TQT3_RICCO|nr:conserved hypothetical protein [Ricinus communis]